MRGAAEAAQKAGLTPPGRLGQLPSHRGRRQPFCRPEVEEEAVKGTFCLALGTFLEVNLNYILYGFLSPPPPPRRCFGDGEKNSPLGLNDRSKHLHLSLKCRN